MAPEGAMELGLRPEKLVAMMTVLEQSRNNDV